MNHPVYIMDKVFARVLIQFKLLLTRYAHVYINCLNLNVRCGLVKNTRELAFITIVKRVERRTLIVSIEHESIVLVMAESFVKTVHKTVHTAFTEVCQAIRVSGCRKSRRRRFERIKKKKKNKRIKPSSNKEQSPN